jgi:hypothetical protein
VVLNFFYRQLKGFARTGYFLLSIVSFIYHRPGKHVHATPFLPVILLGLHVHFYFYRFLDVSLFLQGPNVLWDTFILVPFLVYAMHTYQRVFFM